MRTFIPLAIAVAFALPLAAQAKDEAGSKTTSTNIESLENRYFDHTYPTDTPDERVDRIEKFVFGESSQGTADQRMTKIMATLAADNDLGPTVESQEAAQREKDAAAAAAAAKSNGRQLATRGPGKSQLTSYPDPSSQQEPDPIPDDGSAPTDYPHITALENEILGQSFVGQPLPARLSRLEQKAFGAPSSGPLINRTDALEQYAEKTLHKKAFGVNPQMEAQGSEAAAFNDGGSRQQGPGMLNRVANAFLGGGGGMGPMGSMGNIGFGAPVNSNRGYGQPPQDMMPERQDSPEVYEATPPSATSPTLTKVGWCEVQLMGKTFNEMHLMARLRQINDLLFPSDHETNMQLMDRVDILVKATVAKKAGK